MRSLKALATVSAILAFGCGPAAEEAPEVTWVEEQLFDNNQVTVTRYELPPQSELPMRRGRDRVVYSLTDYKLRVKTPAGQPKISNFRMGEAHWHGAGRLTIKNVGPITAKYLVVERKGSNPTPGTTSNLVELAPKMARIVFENEETKVLEVSLDAGGKTPVHVAASRLAYFLTAAKIKFTAGSESIEQQFTAGDVHWYDGGEHQVENLSAEPVRFVIIELM